jgi:GT2 family glycosyltransferase
MKKTITAIILNYKNYSDIYTCIISLEKQVLPNNYQIKILIIDNGSEDDSTSRLQIKFPEYQYIFNQKNLGFAKAVNQGIKLTQNQSDYFLLVNNDAELDPECLSTLIAYSNNSAVTGPAICYKDEPEKIWQSGGFFSKLRLNTINPLKNKPYKKELSQKVDFLSGCVLLLPKKIILELGLLDENLFFYGEDLDYCLRVKSHNIDITYCAQARAWHNIKNIAENRTSAFVLENLAFSYIYIIKKHFSSLKLYGYFIFIFIYSPFRFYQIIKGDNNLKNIFYWFKGAYRAAKTNYKKLS